MRKIFVTFASTMMRHPSSILLSFIFILGVIIISHEEQPDFRKATEEAVKYAATGCTEAGYSFTASTDCVPSAPQRPIYDDRNTYCQITYAILPGNSYRQCNTSYQLFRLKAFCVGQLQHLFPTCRTEQNRITSFTPSAIRYSYGYYIYALAHILI